MSSRTALNVGVILLQHFMQRYSRYSRHQTVLLKPQEIIRIISKISKTPKPQRFRGFSFAQKSTFVQIWHFFSALIYPMTEYLNNKNYFHKCYTHIETSYAVSAAHSKSFIQISDREMVDRADLLVCFIERERRCSAE